MQKQIALLTFFLVLPGGLYAAEHEGHTTSTPILSGDWTSLPLVMPRTSMRGSAEISLVNSAALSVAVTPPQGQPVNLPVEGGKARFANRIGNYHLISATDSCDTHSATAMSAVYFSSPGPAPTDILAKPSDGLAVMPERLPREHGAYRAGESWRFQVWLDGKPFSDARILFETSAGTKQKLMANADGMVQVTFPNDFPPVDRRPAETHGNPVQSQFVIAAIRQDGPIQKIGAFNYVYRPASLDGTSIPFGTGFIIAGMVAAIPLLRRKKGEPS